MIGNKFLPAVGGGSLGEFFPISSGVVSIKALVNSLISTSNVNFWNTSGVLHASLPEKHECSRIITTVDNTSQMEICNVTSPNGGVLTNIIVPCNTSESEIEIEIIRDGNIVNTFKYTTDSSNGSYRVVLGGYLPYGGVTNTTPSGFLSFTDGGYGGVQQTVLTPAQSMFLGIGLQFDSTCVVTVKSATAALSTLATEANAYCGVMLRKFNGA